MIILIIPQNIDPNSFFMIKVKEHAYINISLSLTKQLKNIQIDRRCGKKPKLIYLFHFHSGKIKHIFETAVETSIKYIWHLYQTLYENTEIDHS